MRMLRSSREMNVDVGAGNVDVGGDVGSRKIVMDVDVGAGKMHVDVDALLVGEVHYVVIVVATRKGWESGRRDGRRWRCGR